MRADYPARGTDEADVCKEAPAGYAETVPRFRHVKARLRHVEARLGTAAALGTAEYSSSVMWRGVLVSPYGCRFANSAVSEDRYTSPSMNPMTKGTNVQQNRR